MRYRQFGNTTLKVSEVGFGAWAIGGNAMVGEVAIGWGKADDKTSIAAIKKSLDQGINFFDTADIYGLGHSEQLLGSTLGNSDKVIVATKVGNVSRDNQFTTDYSKAYIIKACDSSLQRLKRDAIDYYQLHSARVAHLKNYECVEAMQALHKAGKIKFWGLSLNTFDPSPEAELLMENQQGSGFQLVLNILNQKSIGLLKRAAASGYGIIVRMPLQFGLLTGKFTAASKFENDDHRHGRLTSDVIVKANTLLVDKVWELCAKYKTTKTGLALSFVLSFSEVSTVIPGIRTPQHTIDNTANLVTIDKEDVDYLTGLYESDFMELMDLIQQKG